MAFLSFRKIFRRLTPSWLHNGEGELVLYSLGLIQDAFASRMLRGLESRFPTRAGDDALALSGQDRGILRGRDEASAHYAARLLAWRYPRGHRTRGSAWALLEQVWEYFGGGFLVYSVDIRGNRYDRDAAGAETYAAGTTWNWDGAAASPEWARFWLVLDASGFATAPPALGDPSLWGGGLGNGYAIGHEGISPGDVLAIKGLVAGASRDRLWKPAGTRAEWLVVSLDGAEPVPDGTWGPRWSVQDGGGVQRPTRDPEFRYWALSDAVNRYGGDPALFPLSTELVDATTYAGDPTSFPASTTLPDGTSYAGDPNNFPTSILLHDDGSNAR